MIGTILTEHPWLWPLAWQSTLCIAAGIGLSFLLRRHAVRAHQVLLLALVAAISIPALNQIVKHNQWGLLVAERAVVMPQHEAVTPPTDLPMPGQPMATTPIDAPRPIREPETSPLPAQPPFDWAKAILPAWLAISGILFLRLAAQFLLGRRLAKRSEAVEDSPILPMLEVAKDKLGIRTDVEVRTSGHTRSPVIWCWGRRPILLIPPQACRDDGSLDWPSILCHELAHAKRRDHVSGLLAELLLCALPWQPLLWWARQRLAALSEEACDDWVIACGQRATGYARTLLGLTAQGQAAFIPGVVTGRRGLAGRVRRILEDGCGNPRPGLRWTLAAVVLAGCVSLGLALAQTRPAPMDSPAQIAENEAVPPAETISADAWPDIIPGGMVRLRVTDADSRPVTGAAVGAPVRMQKVDAGNQTSKAAAPISDEKGEVLFYLSGTAKRRIFSLDDLEEIRTKKLPQGAVYVLQRQRNLGAICGLTDGDVGKSFDLRLRPLCRVHGTVSSPDLPTAMGLGEIDAEVQWQKIGVLYQSGQDRRLEFPLPPGEYMLILRGVGHGTRTERRAFTVRAGERDLDLGELKLRPTKLATMVGQPAPELGPIQAWRNGPPVTLAQLRDRPVVLYFGGERAATDEIASLAKLQDTFGDQGLTILALFNCASLDELQRNWPNYDTKYGRIPGYDPQYGRMENVPFRIAVDGGEPTRDEATGQTRRGATYAKYDIFGSTTVLIDPAGRVAGEYSPGSGGEIIRTMLAPQTQSADSRAKATPATQGKPPANEDSIHIRLVDTDNRPVAGAQIGVEMVTWKRSLRDSYEIFRRTNWVHPSAPSDENGQVVLDTRTLFPVPPPPINERAIYALHEARRIGAVQEIARADVGKTLSIVLKPVCRIQGSCDSAGLAAIGMPLRSMNAGIRDATDNLEVLKYSSTAPKLEFEFLLPPGGYELSLFGSGAKDSVEPGISTFRADTEFKRFPIIVPAGQPTLDLGVIDLRPTKWATLIGQPAPEIGPMKAWTNGSPVTLADLRGQVVWLRFGRGQSLLTGEGAKLVNLHEALGNKGLTIIMISSDSSLENLERSWRKMGPRFSSVREVPFRIAIDGDAAADSAGTSPRRIGATFERYGVTGYPTDILIDPAGNVLGESNVQPSKEAISQMLAIRQQSPQSARP